MRAATILKRPDDLSWQDRALCATLDDELFFPERDGDCGKQAKQVCRACYVRTECLAYALRNGERHGIWGGMSAGERENITSAGAR